MWNDTRSTLNFETHEKVAEIWERSKPKFCIDVVISLKYVTIRFTPAFVAVNTCGDERYNCRFRRTRIQDRDVIACQWKKTRINLEISRSSTNVIELERIDVCVSRSVFQAVNCNGVAVRCASARNYCANNTLYDRRMIFDYYTIFRWENK